MPNSLWFLATCLVVAGISVMWLWQKRARGGIEPLQWPTLEVAQHSRASMDVQHVAVLPNGFERTVTASIFPLSQIIGTVLEKVDNPAGLYAVTFSPETLEALRSGDLRLMHSELGDRANAVSLNGRITEQGHIVSQRFDIARQCFAAFSLLTGQYFLSRIDTNLRDLASQINKVLEMMDSQERSKLEAAADYVRIAAEDYRVLGISRTSVTALQEHLRECTGIAQRCLTTLNQHSEQKLSAIPLGPIEKVKQGLAIGSEWANDWLSKLDASRRSDALLEATEEFSRSMVRGTIALETALCCEVLLDFENDTIATRRLFGLVNSFQKQMKAYLLQYEPKRDKALNDCWWFESEAKKTRFIHDLASLLDPIRSNLQTLELMREARANRSQLITERLYISVDLDGQPTQVFLPGASN